MTGGRWNSPGVEIVYCSQNIALAALETLSYLRGGALPYNRFLVRIDLPEDIWARRDILDPCPGGWDAVPAGLTSQKLGDGWVTACAELLLAVPSVIIPDESNILINPAHPAAARIVATTVRRWIYDPRFF
jgi:RES domain-containing protein